MKLILWAIGVTVAAALAWFIGGKTVDYHESNENLQDSDIVS